MGSLSWHAFIQPCVLLFSFSCMELRWIWNRHLCTQVNINKNGGYMLRIAEKNIQRVWFLVHHLAAVLAMD